MLGVAFVVAVVSVLLAVVFWFQGQSAASAVHTYLGGLGRLPAPVTPASKAIGVR